MGSSSIWLSGREPAPSDTSSTEVRRDRKLIQMHPYPSQCFVCSSFTCFLLVKDSFKAGGCCRGLPVFWDAESCQTSTLSLCAITSRAWRGAWFVRQPEAAHTPLNTSVPAASLGTCAPLWEGWIQCTAGKCTCEGSLCTPFATEGPSGLAPADGLIQDIWHDLGHRSGLQCQTMLRPSLPPACRMPFQLFFIL